MQHLKPARCNSSKNIRIKQHKTGLKPVLRTAQELVVYEIGLVKLIVLDKKVLEKKKGRIYGQMLKGPMLNLSVLHLWYRMLNEI